MKHDQVDGFDDGLIHGLEAVSTQDRQATLELLLTQSGNGRRLLLRSGKAVGARLGA
jgi:hypothetical protein